MKSIIKNDVVIITVNNPTFVFQMENGCFGLCTEEKAQGVVIDGEVFHIKGTPALEGKEDVIVEEVSETQYAVESKKAKEEAENINAITFVTLAEAGNIDEVTAGEHAEIFSEWVSGVFYSVGNIRKYGGKLYKCLQAHTSQAYWTPETAVSLWVNISDPAEEFPEWSQPVGAHDAYSKNDKVKHNGAKWVSTVDANVWEPGAYGWEVVE